MDWDQIEIKWAEMTKRLKYDGSKSSVGSTMGVKIAPSKPSEVVPKSDIVHDAKREVSAS